MLTMLNPFDSTLIRLCGPGFVSEAMWSATVRVQLFSSASHKLVYGFMMLWMTLQWLKH